MSRNERELIPAVLSALGWVRPPGGGVSSDTAILAGLLERWLTAVPFENLSRLIAAAARPVGRGRIEPPRPFGRPRASRIFWTDHLAHGAGGTCFDQAAAARRLFQALGWSAEPRLAWPPDPSSRPHVALRVASASGAWLVDPGYPLPVPLPLDAPAVVRVSHAWYDVELRRGPDADEYLVFTEDSRGRKFRYRFLDRPPGGAAWRAGWRTAGDRDARYMRRPALGRYTPLERTIYHPSGRIIRLSRNRQVETAIDAGDAAALAAAFRLPEPFVCEGLAALETLRRRERQ